MKTFLVFADPSKFSTVVALLQQQCFTIVNQLEMISVITVNCNQEQKNSLQQMDGVLSVEEEGTSYAM